MRVFVTGATGFIGSALIPQLIGAGHEVLGLCRSEAGAARLAAAGAQAHPGALEDSASLASGAAEADAVVHLAFNHDFSKYAANCEADRAAIAALGSGPGDGRLLIVTSGTGMASVAPGEPARENSPALSSDVMPRSASEEAAAAVATKGGRVLVVRLPQVHDTRRQGLVSPAIDLFRAKGVCGYIGEGANRWAAAHVTDVARLYRLALEEATPNAVYHAVAEEGVTTRAIAEALGRRLRLPVRSIAAEEAADYFGWLALFAGLDMPACSEETRRRLGWNPAGPGLIADLEALELAEG